MNHHWIEPLRLSRGILLLVFGGVYLAAAELGHGLSFSLDHQAFATFWPPAGLLLGSLLLSRYSFWPWLLATAFGANLIFNLLLHQKTVLVSLGYCCANGAESLLGAWLLRRRFGRHLTLGKVREVLAFVLLAGVLSPALAAVLGAKVACFAFEGTQFGSCWLSWWIADALGVLLVGSVVLTVGAQRFSGKFLSRWRLVEGGCLLICITFATQAIYANWLPVRFAVPAFILPFLLWAALRLGPRVVSVAVLVVAVVGIFHTTQGRGPFTLRAMLPAEQLVRTQGVLAVISLCLLLMTATVEERKRAEEGRIRLIGELEQALKEIKTLCGLIPLCAWCKKIRDDQGFWQRLEDYLRAHTQARFTHGMCPDCLKSNLEKIPTDPGARTTPLL